MRTGLITRKLGMSAVFEADGRHVPVTVLELENCQVVGHKTLDRDGYAALQLGTGNPKVKNISKSLRGKYSKAKIEPKRKLIEFRVSEDQFVDVGQELTVEHFIAGQYVDVVGTTKGKGFAGGMKRHGFSGLRASHGVSINHRSLGSTGQCQDPGKVFKGKKMAGHLGDVRATQQNLLIVSTDVEKGLIYVKGSVPGSKGSYIMLSDSVKRQLPKDVPTPAATRVKSDQPAGEEKNSLESPTEVSNKEIEQPVSSTEKENNGSDSKEPEQEG